MSFFLKKVLSWYRLLLGFALPSISTPLCHSQPRSWDGTSLKPRAKAKASAFSWLLVGIPAGPACPVHVGGKKLELGNNRGQALTGTAPTTHSPPPTARSRVKPPGLANSTWERRTKVAREKKNRELEMKREADWQKGTSTWLQAKNFCTENGRVQLYCDYVAKNLSLNTRKGISKTR